MSAKTWPEVESHDGHVTSLLSRAHAQKPFYYGFGTGLVLEITDVSYRSSPELHQT